MLHVFDIQPSLNRPHILLLKERIYRVLECVIATVFSDEEQMGGLDVIITLFEFLNRVVRLLRLLGD